MDVRRSSTSSPTATETDFVPRSHGHSKSFIHQFSQQSLPACKSLLSLVWVFEIVYRYDAEFVPEPFRSNKLTYIKYSSISKNCSKALKIPKRMKDPVYIYYQLDNCYQNHRRHVKSRSDQQLLRGMTYQDTMVNRKNIAWKSDRDHKFGKQVYPFNFQNGTLIGGAKLDPHIPLNDQEDLMVWMRALALPSFQTLYGRIEEDLDADDIISVKFLNNYNTYSFSGNKKLVISTSSWLGGHNNFLGVTYISAGSFFILVAIVFVLLHLKNPK